MRPAFRRITLSLGAGLIFLLGISAGAEETPVGASTSAEPKKEVLIGDELLKLRDPFRKPDVIVTKLVPKTELERYPVDAFKLVGVLTGSDRLRAMVLAPDGKTYFVAEKMKIGLRGGTVRKIQSDMIQIREKIVNLVGQEENIDSEIRLPSEEKGGSGSK